MNPYTRTCRACDHEKPTGRFRGTDHTCRDCRSAEGRRKRAVPSERRRARDRRLVRLYGITLAEYEALGRRQRWRCAICDRTAYPAGSRLVPDHNHDTGEVRGLLCGPCNSGLGLFGEKPDRLQAAAEYLRTRGAYPDKHA